MGHEQEYHGSHYLSAFISLVASIFLSEITGNAWERVHSKIWSIRGLLCFNKFKAAIYENFYKAAIVKPLTINSHNKE